MCELAQVMNINEIKVTDIANYALIQRATFYNHYNGISDVLADIEKDMAELLGENIAIEVPDTIRQAVEKSILGIYKSITELNRCYRGLLIIRNDAIVKIIKQALTENFLEIFKNRRRVLSDFERYTVIGLANSLVDSYFMWSEEHPSDDISLFMPYAESFAGVMSAFIKL